MKKIGTKLKIRTDYGNYSFVKICDNIYIYTIRDNDMLQGGSSFCVNERQAKKILKHLGDEDKTTFINSVFSYDHEITKYMSIFRLGLNPESIKLMKLIKKEYLTELELVDLKFSKKAYKYIAFHSSRQEGENIISKYIIYINESTYATIYRSRRKED